jgi:hypothetical protein
MFRATQYQGLTFGTKLQVTATAPESGEQQLPPRRAQHALYTYIHVTFMVSEHSGMTFELNVHQMPYKTLNNPVRIAHCIHSPVVLRKSHSKMHSNNLSVDNLLVTPPIYTTSATVRQVREFPALQCKSTLSLSSGHCQQSSL